MRIAVAALATIVAGIAACSSRIGDIAGPKPMIASRPTKISPDQPYFEFQVEKQVQQIPGSGNLRYPDVLRSANVEGEVLAQFVVDVNGVAEPGTFKVLKSDHELFTQAVMTALPDMRFYAALIGGVKVRQLVQQPFTFALSKSLAKAPTPGVLRLSGPIVTAPRQGAPTRIEAVAVPPRDSVAKGIAIRSVTMPVSTDKPYFEFQVKKGAQQIPGTGNLRYPDVLRSANITGEVLAQFVVDANGAVEVGSFKVLKSSHELFTESVRTSLSNMRFTPAEVDGRQVKQLIQMPFTFSISQP